MTPQSELLEQLLEAHLTGQPLDVPPALQAEFEQALAAHGALRELLDETLLFDKARGDARLPPQVSDDYDIERELGRGGMGVVYLARQRSLNRRVALKVLRPAERTFGPLVQRFLDEAQHLARLRHPNIISIHEIGNAAGEPYFTMDFIDGESLAAVLARGPLTPTRAVAVLKQVAAAVQHAHQHGIIHRDLKPGNVLIDQAGQVFVTDFGLARNVSQESSLTQSGELLGTPQYMAPEQARGQTSLVGEATDIHALGLLLFEMLTGRAAYGASSPADVLVKLLHHQPPLLRRLDRRIPRDLETICLKALQKVPGERYANVSALLEDLRRYEAGEPLLARRTSLFTRSMRWAARHWKMAAAVLITAVLVAAIAPRLFDKSLDELVAWGDEELASGQPDIAAQVYLRAWRRAPAEERQRLAARMVQTCRQLQDSKAAVDLALQIVEFVPEASFGPHDYLVAQALVTRERSQSPVGAIDPWRDQPRPALELVKARLELALAARLTDQQQIEAEATLAAIKSVLSADEPWVRYEPEYLYKLPTGTAAELQALLDDEGSAIWNRARAAVALGKLHEQTWQAADALAAYRRALELMRSVYPMYAGVKAATGSQPSRVAAPDAEECLLVRELVNTIRRLSPADLPEPRGQIVFDVVGAELPDSIGIELTLELCDPAIDNPDQGLPHRLPRLVPLRRDIPVSVQVLDGRYRLKYRGHHRGWDDSVAHLARLMQVDVDQWPEEIEVRGDTVKLPPVRLHLADEIKLLSPANGMTVNLPETELRWQPIPNAVRYQVQLHYTVEAPSPSTVFFGTVTTDSPSLRLADLGGSERAHVRENLIPGRTGGWQVDAYDATGKRIGVSLVENRFLVAGALEGP